MTTLGRFTSADGRAIYVTTRDGARRRVTVDPDTGEASFRKRPGKKGRRAEKRARKLGRSR